MEGRAQVFHPCVAVDEAMHSLLVVAGRTLAFLPCVGVDWAMYSLLVAE